MLALAGDLDVGAEQILRGLLAGLGPDGQQMVGQVRRSDPRARVPAAPLVAAVRAAAKAAGLPPALFLDPPAAAEFARVVRGLTRSTRSTVGVRAVVAVRVAAAAGLDAHAIYAAAAPDHPALLAAALGHVGDRVDARRAGVDLTFSAPKSVSVLFAFGDSQVVAAVRAGHETAIGQALAYLEQVAAHGLRGHHGDGQRARRVRTDGLVGVAFEHRTSRAMDPQLHTHVVVPNLVHGTDGQWSALDTRALHRHARTAGYLYQAVLRGQLTQTLGVRWKPVRRGQADIDGIPADALRVFSTRRAQIDAQLDAAGASGGRAAQVACLTTRLPKSDPDPVDSATGLRERWVALAWQAGIDPDQLLRAALTPTTDGTGTAVADTVTLDRLTQTLLGPTGLTEHVTWFERADVIRAVCELLPVGTATSHHQLQAMVDEVLADPDAVPLIRDADSDDGREPASGSARRWTTRELLSVEAQSLAAAAVLHEVHDRGVSDAIVQDCVDAAALTGEQAGMVAALTAAGGALRLVVGPAGSGKTAALAVAHRAWRAAGRPVHGCALSALAARGLQTASGIPAGSVAALLSELEQGRTRIAPGTVLIVDEAAMVGTRDLARLLAHATDRGMTLVLVGDPAQLPEIGAGGLFAHLTHHVTATQLSGNQRQSAGWEQAALTRLRDGDVPGALDSYLAHRRIHPSPDHQHLQDTVAEDYLVWRDRLADSGDAGGVLVVAATRRHTAQINAGIRDRLADRGDLAGPELDCGTSDDPLLLRRGDRVLVTTNDHHRGLLNGEQAQVASVDVARAQVVLTTADRGKLAVPAAWAAQHLGHGYALTCHKAQGQTVAVTLVAGSAALTRETTYTALSRGRSANHLYLAPDSPLDPRDDAVQAWISDHALADATRYVRTSRRQNLATALHPARHPFSTPAPDPTAIGF